MCLASRYFCSRGQTPPRPRHFLSTKSELRFLIWTNAGQLMRTGTAIFAAALFDATIFVGALLDALFKRDGA